MRLLLALAAALAFAPAAGAETIYVENTSRAVSDRVIRDALPVFEAASVSDFRPFWGVSAELVFACGPLPEGARSIVVSDTLDLPFAQGFHDVDGGVPYAKVAAQTAIDSGASWEVTFTHELWEMLADPWTDRAALTDGGFYLVEVADPVEADRFMYLRSSPSGLPVELSDFVTPAWYSGAPGPLDFTGHVKRARQVLGGGYANVWRYSNWWQLGGP